MKAQSNRGRIHDRSRGRWSCRLPESVVIGGGPIGRIRLLLPDLRLRGDELRSRPLPPVEDADERISERSFGQQDRPIKRSGGIERGDGKARV
jgi:hypothetical protein